MNTSTTDQLLATKTLRRLVRRIRSKSLQDIVKEWDDRALIVAADAIQEDKERPLFWWEYLVGKDQSVFWDVLLVKTTAEVVAEARKSALYTA